MFSNQDDIFNDSIVGYIKEQKNEEYRQTINSFVDIYQKFAAKEFNMFCYHVDSDNEYIIRYYAKQSTEMIKQLLSKLHEKLIIDRGTKMKLFAKRETENKIRARFNDLNITIYVLNFRFIYDRVRKYHEGIKNIKYRSRMLLLDEILHVLLFSDMYRGVEDYYIPKLLSIRDSIKVENKTILIPSKRIHIDHFTNLIMKIDRDLVIIGKYAASKAYGIGEFNSYHDTYEFIYTGKDFNIMQDNLYHSLKRKKHYRVGSMRFSDHNILNSYITIKRGRRPYVYIYNGNNYCIPYINMATVNKKKFRVGTMTLIVKYMLGRMIYDGKNSEKDIRSILDLIPRIDFENELFSEQCRGVLMSPYYRYHSREFQRKRRPWNYGLIVRRPNGKSLPPYFVYMGTDRFERSYGELIDVSDIIEPIRHNRCRSVLDIVDNIPEKDISISISEDGKLTLRELTKRGFERYLKDIHGIVYFLDPDEFDIDISSGNITLKPIVEKISVYDYEYVSDVLMRLMKCANLIYYGQKETLLYDAYVDDKESLKNLLTKYNKGEEIYELIEELIEKTEKTDISSGNTIPFRNTDIVLYEKVRKWIGGKIEVFSGKYEIKRADKRANEFLKILPKKPVKSYLDIGTGKGFIAAAMGQKLGVKAKAIDIIQDVDKSLLDEIEFSIYDGIIIPYKHLDLVTLIMVLHHVENLEKLLSNLYDSMSVGGHILVRDHDINSDTSRRLAMIQHQIMFELYGEDATPTRECFECYKSKKEIVEMFEKQGFKTIRVNNTKYFKDKYNPTRYFYVMFVK